MKAEPLEFSIWAVGGGKGGTGKSVMSTLLAITLARLGRQVVLLDADLGGANLHSLFGTRLPAVTLNDFVEKRVTSLEEAAIETGVPGLRLISGASDILSLANPKYAQKTRILNAIRKLHADVVLLDLGAGTHFNTLDFALLAHQQVVVLTPQMTSIENAYGFIKGMLYRRLERVVKEESPLWPHLQPALKPEPGAPTVHIVDCVQAAREAGGEELETLEQILRDFHPRVLVNQAQAQTDPLAGGVVANVAGRYLGVTPVSVGQVPTDPDLRRAIDQLRPLYTLPTGSPSILALRDVVRHLEKLDEARLAQAA